MEPEPVPAPAPDLNKSGDVATAKNKTIEAGRQYSNEEVLSIIGHKYRPALMAARKKFKRTKYANKGRKIIYDGAELLKWFNSLHK